MKKYGGRMYTSDKNSVEWNDSHIISWMVGQFDPCGSFLGILSKCVLGSLTWL